MKRNSRKPEQTPDQKCAALASTQHGVISRADALNFSLSRAAIVRRVKSGKWQEVLPGVYKMSGAPDSWRQRLLSACSWAGPGAVASHRSAAALWEMDGIEPELIEISRVIHRRVPDWIVQHQLEVSVTEATKLNRIPVTNPHRTILDLGAVVSETTLQLAFESALRRKLVSVAFLREQLEGPAVRRWGVSKLRNILESGSTRRATDSWLEVQVERMLRRSGLPEPIRQFEVRDGKRFVARVDFAYPAEMLAIEADGFAYHSGRNNWERDLKRLNELTLCTFRPQGAGSGAYDLKVRRGPMLN